MKTYLSALSRQNDIQCVWDDVDRVWITNVAVNRLPDIEVPTASLEQMAKGLEQLREKMKPIGKGHDGEIKRWKEHQKEQGLAYLQDLQKKGYHVSPFTLENWLNFKPEPKKVKQSLPEHVNALIEQEKKEADNKKKKTTLRRPDLSQPKKSPPSDPPMVLNTASKKRPSRLK